MTNGSQPKLTRSVPSFLQEDSNKENPHLIEERVKTREINEQSTFEEPISIELDREIPLVSRRNANTVIPHDKLPVRFRQKMVAEYGEDFVIQKEWTIGIMEKLSVAMGNPKVNMTTNIAQICGPNCTFQDTCPHGILGMQPIGERCPQELMLMRVLFKEYLKAVATRLDADEEDLKEDIIYHNLIMGLVESDIISMRLDGSLARDGFISESVSAINEESGEVFYKDEEAISIRIKDRVYRRKDQLYRQLIATPEMAEKYKKKGNSDQVSRSVDLLDRIEDLLHTITKKQAIDAEVVK